MVLCKKVLLCSPGDYGTLNNMHNLTLPHAVMCLQSKHMIVLKDETTKDIIHFLEHCESKICFFSMILLSYFVF